MKIKHLILTLFIASSFTACATNKNKVEQQTPFTNEVNSKELFENKENWKAINKNNVQDLKNFEKVVK